MENKFNVLDPVLVYATIDSITQHNGVIIYSLKVNTFDENFEYIDGIEEESIQTVF